MAVVTDGVYSAAEDLVAILDSTTFEPLFVPASPMRVSVDRTKIATRYQVEDGTSRNDHVVFEPVDIGLDLILTGEDVRNQYANLAQAFARNALVIVQTKASSYSNMLIYQIPYDETVSLGDAVSVLVRLQEWRQVQPTYGALPASKVANKAQSNTVNRGAQQAPASAKRQSLLFEIFH